MNEQRRQRLEREISIVNNITIKAQEAYLIVSYLEKDEDDNAIMYHKRMNTFFYYSRVIYWQITIIELAKLLNEKEKFSIARIIAKVKKDGDYSELGVPAAQIHKWEAIMRNENESIINLKEQRDKVYAHEDGSENINNLIPLFKIEILLGLCKDIILEFGKLLGLPHRMFDVINSPAISLKHGIHMIAKKSNNEMEKYRDLARQYNLEDELPPETS